VRPGSAEQRSGHEESGISLGGVGGSSARTAASEGERTPSKAAEAGASPQDLRREAGSDAAAEGKSEGRTASAAAEPADERAEGCAEPATEPAAEARIEPTAADERSERAEPSAGKARPAADM
jgi:hypothetical protein